LGVPGGSICILLLVSTVLLLKIYLILSYNYHSQSISNYHARRETLSQKCEQSPYGSFQLGHLHSPDLLLLAPVFMFLLPWGSQSTDQVLYKLCNRHQHACSPSQGHEGKKRYKDLMKHLGHPADRVNTSQSLPMPELELLMKQSRLKLSHLENMMNLKITQEHEMDCCPQPTNHPRPQLPPMHSYSWAMPASSNTKSSKVISTQLGDKDFLTVN
jgi:hypothetical protein